MGALRTIGDGLQDTFLMAWQVWWALVLGFTISAIVQAWVPRERIQSALGGSGLRPVAIATGLGAASSSCSYAAIAIAKSLFEKGASAASALAFQFSSTNLVFELGIVMWVLIGWQFTLAEFVGGLVLIAVMTLLLRVFVSPRVEEQARLHAQRADETHEHHAAHEHHGGHDHHHEQEHEHEHRDDREGTMRTRLRSASAWSEVAHNFRGDWSMLWKEITAGFFLAGFISQLPPSFFSALFITHAGAGARLVENAIVGPIVAALSFVCSVGNVPLAAVLWSGGISFGGVIAFIFADLIVLPIVQIYRKYYGDAYAWRIVALMFVTMVLAALIVDGLFSAAGLVPSIRPTHTQIFSPIAVNYTLFADVLAVAAFAALLGLSTRPTVPSTRPRQRPHEGRP